MAPGLADMGQVRVPLPTPVSVRCNFS